MLIYFSNIGLKRVVPSAPMICNTKDDWCAIGYKVEYPLHVKSPIKCYSNAVSRYDKNYSWKMGVII